MNIFCRFKKGLGILGVLEEVKQNPVSMKDAFLFTTELLDATAVEGIFPISNWSLEGSNRYKREKKTATHWRDLLQDLEGNAERYNMSAHHSVSLVCASCNNLYVY